MGIATENKLENKILTNPVFQEGIKYSYQSNRHPEKNIEEHIHQIIEFIDKQDWDEYRSDLRILALLHDIGKFKTEYSEKGNIIGKGHSELSHEISKEMINNQDILNIIKIHDKYIHFFNDKIKKNKFNEDKFKRIYNEISMPLLIRFNYADSNNREKIPINWFEDRCFDLDSIKEKIYLTNPKLRDN